LGLGDDFLELVIDRGFRHAETLMPAVASVLDQAGISPKDLNLVSCSAGPGSFTGLRIGMATAKGIARGAGCPLKAVPTLPLLASGREHWPGIVVPLMDARKKRVYAAAFRGNDRIRDDQDTDLEDFLRSLSGAEPILLTGPDARIAAGLSSQLVLDPLHASGRGRSMVVMAESRFRVEGPDPPDLGPVYLRLSEAEEALGNRP
jgi:tRNA threonylcarbamoyladenosine biosynthesis protein TsaB